MRCDTVRIALLDFANGEIRPLRAWAIRRHLAVCAACAEELASLQRFNVSLRRVDLVPPLPVSLPVPVRSALVCRRTAIAVAALLVGALLLLPALYQGRRAERDPTAAIAAALGRVNTWHFSGWKLMDGKQVPWEVWGRRQPFLYYEQVGDITTWADGKQRLRVFAPNPALKRPQGMVIKSAMTTTTADAGFEADLAYQTLANDQANRGRFGDGATKLYEQTPAIARFRRPWYEGMSGVNENKLYTISKRDWLPMTYQLHFENSKFARDTEFLRVRYDVDLPEAVVNPPSPNSYTVVDFTLPAKEAAAPSGSRIAESHGLRVQAEPIGMDKEGNVLVVTRGWLGGNQLTNSSTFSLNVSPCNGAVFGLRRGQKVKYLYAVNSLVPPGGDIYLPFAPLEPSEVARSLPDTLRLSLAVSPQVLVRSSDQLDADGGVHPVTTTEILFTDTFSWTLSLPLKSVISLAALVPLQIWQSFGFAAGTLPAGAHPSRQFELDYGLAGRRSFYYYAGYDYLYTTLEQVAPQLAQTGVLDSNGILITPQSSAVNNLDALRKHHPATYRAAELRFRARGAYWQKRRVEMLPVSGATQSERFRYLSRRILELSTLALYYRKAEDKAGQNRTLREIIRLSRPLPAFASTIRQAEYSLRTGQFPGDANYKGPS